MSAQDRSAACDCHLHENQVCDVCQGVDPDNPSPDAEPSAAYLDRESMLAAVRERGTPTSIHDLFECVGKAGRDIARAIREGDEEAGPNACSAFLHAIEMMPSSLREDIIVAARDRPGLDEWPDLREFAHDD